LKHLIFIPPLPQDTDRFHFRKTFPRHAARAALDGFRDGAFQILVATDIAARGITEYINSENCLDTHF
jgi:hypothetical protein